MAESTKITTRQHKAILALLSTKSVSEAAQQAAVPERTLWRWLGDPQFRAHLAGAEADLLDAATRSLLQMQGNALETVQTIMQGSESDAVRLRAAQTVLDHLLKLRELRNVEQRLTALELAYADNQKAPTGSA